MKISYQWLKDYIDFDLTPEETAKYLTDCGLEVEGIEQFESVKGGLRGLVIGEVLTCEPHPDSDHLHLTTVNVGAETPLNIVCGAPNVAAGQKVVVATIGTTLYDGDESFTIKKSKIRGAVSEGMLCAEDEIGVGTAHDGIMVLPTETPVGTDAANYFNVLTDAIFEIGLTPNRSDAISHFGVARDLHAALKINHVKCSAPILPTTHDLTINTKKNNIDVIVDNAAACPRYSGVALSNITVAESPQWLQTRLRAIGVRPVNNIVDITQFVMFEIGQPLHAFDADKIAGNKVIIKNLANETSFKTLDGNEVKLSDEDLMICDSEKGMCIAGVFGGIHSGVSENTKNIFLESAYFNPVSIRKTSKRHSLKTDAAFRYERGCDPNITLYALQRAANLMTKIAGATIASEIFDLYPKKIECPKISLRYDDINRIAGKKIDKQTVSNILLLLGMEVQASGEEQLMVTVPLYKVDVTRPIDLIEEILRIYGYNNIEIPEILSYNINVTPSLSAQYVKQKITNWLVDNGFFEIMNNSLTKSNYAPAFDFMAENQTVTLLNPLSSELGVLRQSLMFSGLENIVRNVNNKNANLKLFEMGRIYLKNGEKSAENAVTERFSEIPQLALFVTGKNHDEVWNETAKELDVFYLKNVIDNILRRVNFPTDELHITTEQNSQFLDSLVYHHNEKKLLTIGQLHPKILKYFDLKKPVYYAEIDLETLYAQSEKRPVVYQQIPAYPAVKRDLALILDKAVTYQKLEEVAYKFGGKMLKKVTLFDVYEGDKMEAGKKSYALNFVLQHPDKTLTDEDINKVMNKLIGAFEREVGAKLR